MWQQHGSKNKSAETSEGSDLPLQGYMFNGMLDDKEVPSDKLFNVDLDDESFPNLVVDTSVQSSTTSSRGSVDPMDIPIVDSSNESNRATRTPVKRKLNAPKGTKMAPSTSSLSSPEVRSPKVLCSSKISMQEYLLRILSDDELKKSHALVMMGPMTRDDINKMKDSRCMVCFAPVASMNCGRVTCSGCMAFFRSAIQSRKEFECTGLRENNCCINVEIKRMMCLKCRLRKCLLIGMDPLMVREDLLSGNPNNQKDRNRRGEMDVSQMIPSPRTSDRSVPTSYSSVVSERSPISNHSTSPSPNAANSISNISPTPERESPRSHSTVKTKMKAVSSINYHSVTQKFGDPLMINISTSNHTSPESMTEQMDGTLTFSALNQSLERYSADHMPLLSELLHHPSTTISNTIQQHLHLPPSPITSSESEVLTQTLQKWQRQNTYKRHSKSYAQGSAGNVSRFSRTSTRSPTSRSFLGSNSDGSCSSRNESNHVSPSHHYVSYNNYNRGGPSILINLLIDSPEEHSNPSSIPSTTSLASAVETLEQAKDHVNIDKLSQCIETMENRVAVVGNPQSSDSTPDHSMSLLSRDEMMKILNTTRTWLRMWKLEEAPFDVPIMYQKITAIMKRKYGNLFEVGSTAYLSVFIVAVAIHFSNYWAYSESQKKSKRQSSRTAIFEFITGKLQTMAYNITDEVDMLVKRVAELASVFLSLCRFQNKVFRSILVAHITPYELMCDDDDVLVGRVKGILSEINDILPRIHPYLVLMVFHVCCTCADS